MVTRIFREFVWTLQTAGTVTDVHDVSGIMQDIAPRKGFKLLGARMTVNIGDLAAVDHSEIYLNILKNISEAAHHLDPGTDGEMTDVRVDGVIISQQAVFDDGIDTLNFEWDLPKPIVFDGNDRMNVELTFNNKDAASADAIFRLFLDIEIA